MGRVGATGAPSVLDERVCDGSHEGLLAVCSLSKRSNLAGYRAAFVAGDPVLVRELLEVRRHAGMIVPAPVQAAMVAALDDEPHVHEQHARYRARREVLRAAFERAGWRVDGSEAGLYLWVTRDEDCWASLDSLARLGILAAPGEFYGPAGEQARAGGADRHRRAGRGGGLAAHLDLARPYAVQRTPKGRPLSTATCTWSRWRSTAFPRCASWHPGARSRASRDRPPTTSRCGRRR